VLVLVSALRMALGESLGEIKAKMTSNGYRSELSLG
jgi:hypothetical protein